MIIVLGVSADHDPSSRNWCMYVHNVHEKQYLGTPGREGGLYEYSVLERILCTLYFVWPYHLGLGGSLQIKKSSKGLTAERISTTCTKLKSCSSTARVVLLSPSLFAASHVLVRTYVYTTLATLRTHLPYTPSRSRSRIRRKGQ